MKHFSESDLERFAQHPEVLSEDVRLAIEACSRENDVVRAIIEFFRDFYAEVDSLDVHMSEKIARFTERLFSSVPSGPLEFASGDGAGCGDVDISPNLLSLRPRPRRPAP